MGGIKGKQQRISSETDSIIIPSRHGVTIMGCNMIECRKFFLDFCTEEGRFAVDESNMCWYHACVNSENGLTSIPRRCALGSKISYNFVAGNTNPCTYNFDDVIGGLMIKILTLPFMNYCQLD